MRDLGGINPWKQSLRDVQVFDNSNANDYRIEEDSTSAAAQSIAGNPEVERLGFWSYHYLRERSHKLSPASADPNRSLEDLAKIPALFEILKATRKW